MKVVLILFIPYMIFGVLNPELMAYINNTTMMYMYIVGTWALNGYVLLAILIRTYFGIN
jgi:hypothetical protein